MLDFSGYSCSHNTLSLTSTCEEKESDVTFSNVFAISEDEEKILSLFASNDWESMQLACQLLRAFNVSHSIFVMNGKAIFIQKGNVLGVVSVEDFSTIEITQKVKIDSFPESGTWKGEGDAFFIENLGETFVIRGSRVLEKSLRQEASKMFIELSVSLQMIGKFLFSDKVL